MSYAAYVDAQMNNKEIYVEDLTPMSDSGGEPVSFNLDDFPDCDFTIEVVDRCRDVYIGVEVKPYRIYCLTSDKYIHAIRPLAYLMDKYWPDHPEVVVGGFSTPPFEMPKKFIFHSMGKFKDYPVWRWSDGLIKMMSDLGDDVFMLMLEDMWPIRPVYGDIIKMAYDYMVQFEYVARLDLTGDRAGANGGDVSLYGKLGHVDLVWSDPLSQYHLSMMPAFWRREHLERVLIPGETPWDVELSGTPRLRALHREMIVLGTNAWPYKNTLAFRGGDVSALLLDEVDSKHVRSMRELGLFDGLE